MAAVDDAQARRRRELRPVGGARQPVKVVPINLILDLQMSRTNHNACTLPPEERVVGGSAVHEPVGDDGGRVADGDAHRVLRPLQDQRVSLVVPHKQLKQELN